MGHHLVHMTPNVPKYMCFPRSWTLTPVGCPSSTPPDMCRCVKLTMTERANEMSNIFNSWEKERQLCDLVQAPWFAHPLHNRRECYSHKSSQNLQGDTTWKNTAQRLTISAVMWQWLKIRVPNDPQKWSCLVGKPSILGVDNFEPLPCIVCATYWHIVKA